MTKIKTLKRRSIILFWIISIVNGLLFFSEVIMAFDNWQNGSDWKDKMLLALSILMAQLWFIQSTRWHKLAIQTLNLLKNGKNNTI